MKVKFLRIIFGEGGGEKGVGENMGYTVLNFGVGGAWRSLKLNIIAVFRCKWKTWKT